MLEHADVAERIARASAMIFFQLDRIELFAPVSCAQATRWRTYM
jgi:hypothetical protein